MPFRPGGQGEEEGERLGRYRKAQEASRPLPVRTARIAERFSPAITLGRAPTVRTSRRRWNESLHAAVGFQASLNWVAARTIRETYLLGIKHSLKGHAKMVSLPAEVQAAYDAGFEKGLG